MTTQIAQFLVRLEAVWDDHLRAALHGDLDGALANMVAEPSVRHLPAMTGADGREALRRFYAEELFGHLPADLACRRLSRTVDRFRLVDETTVSFTHDRELPWLLPGVAPTGKRAEALTVAIVSFRRGEIAVQRVLWDLATLTAQLGLAAGEVAVTAEAEAEAEAENVAPQGRAGGARNIFRL